jgi:hypothetical protein
MVNIVLGLLIAVIFAAAVYKIYSDRKKGKCTGCPYSSANGKKGDGCSCRF